MNWVHAGVSEAFKKIIANISNLSEVTELEVIEISKHIVELKKSYRSNAEKSEQVMKLLQEGMAFDLDSIKNNNVQFQKRFCSNLLKLRSKVARLDMISIQLNKIEQWQRKVQGFATDAYRLSLKLEVKTVPVSQVDFLYPVQDIKQLSNYARDHIQNFAVTLHSAKELMAGQHATLFHKLNLLVKQANYRTSPLKRILSDLASIKELFLRGCSEVKDSTGYVTPELSKVVQALQFHDIIRQQLEHVCQLLSSIDKDYNFDLEDNTGNPPPWNWVKLLCQLQIKQLVKVSSESQQMHKKVLQHFEQIQYHSQQQTKHTKEAMRGKDQLERVIQELKGEFDVVILLMKEQRLIIQEYHQLVIQLKEVLNQLFLEIKEVEMVQEELQILVLNSKLKTQSLTGDFPTLEGIFNAIHDLAIEIQSLFKSEYKELEKTSTATQEINQDIDQELKQQIKAMEQLDQESSNEINKLSEAKDSVLQTMTLVIGVTSDLNLETEQFIQGLNFNHKTQKEVKELLVLLNTLLAQSQKKEEPKYNLSNKVMKEKITTIYQIYTMEQEKSVLVELLQEKTWSPYSSALDGLEKATSLAEESLLFADPANKKQQLDDDIVLF